MRTLIAQLHSADTDSSDLHKPYRSQKNRVHVILRSALCSRGSLRCRAQGSGSGVLGSGLKITGRSRSPQVPRQGEQPSLLVAQTPAGIKPQGLEHNGPRQFTSVSAAYLPLFVASRTDEDRAVLYSIQNYVKL